MRFKKFYYGFDKNVFMTPTIYIRKNNPLYMRSNLLIAIDIFCWYIGWRWESEE